MTGLVMGMLVMVWLLSAVIGAVLYYVRGLQWGFLGGPVGLLMLVKIVAREEAEARHQAASGDRLRAARARQRLHEERPLRWTN